MDTNTSETPKSINSSAKSFNTEISSLQSPDISKTIQKNILPGKINIEDKNGK